MKYYHNLYLSDELKEKKEGIIYKLEHDKIQLNKYVIVLAEMRIIILSFTIRHCCCKGAGKSEGYLWLALQMVLKRHCT